MFVEYSFKKEVMAAMIQPYFYERLWAVMQEDGVNIPFGDFYSKYKKNGVKCLKALGLYKTTGRGSNKKVCIHRKLKFIIESTIEENSIVAKTIIDALNGVYVGLEKFEVENFDAFYQLKDFDYVLSESNYGTYVVYSPKMNLFKIGKTKNLAKRVLLLQSEYDLGIKIIAFCKKDIESFMHLKYKANRQIGEWFKFDKSEIFSICSENGFETIEMGWIKNENDLLSFLSK